MVPDFFPFPGLRYAPDVVGAPLERLTAPPYDVIDAEMRARLEAAHPHNTVHLILPREDPEGDGYRRAAVRFADWQGRGLLAVDPPHFYVYRMSFDEAGRRRTTTGVIGALALSAPEAGSVLPHERTMAKPRGDRLDLLRAVRANLDPVWCLSLASGLSDLLAPDGAPRSASVDAEGVTHELFLLPTGRAAEVSRLVASAPAVIADGHHRYETALAYAAEAGEGGDGAGAGAGAIMALVSELSPGQLSVGPIHRLFPVAPDRFRERLGQTCDLRPLPGTDDMAGVLANMEREAAMTLVDGAGAALVVPRAEALDPRLRHLPEALRLIDSARLEAALAGIDADLTFQHDAATAVAEVTKGTAGAAVLMRPVSVEAIAAVAATGVRMPEKSTFFRPKPLTGMVFRNLAG